MAGRCLKRAIRVTRPKAFPESYRPLRKGEVLLTVKVKGWVGTKHEFFRSRETGHSLPRLGSVDIGMTMSTYRTIEVTLEIGFYIRSRIDVFGTIFIDETAK